MAVFKQPRVPEYRESKGVGRYLHDLVRFLRDFCNDVWTDSRQKNEAIQEMQERISALEDGEG